MSQRLVSQAAACVLRSRANIALDQLQHDAGRKKTATSCTRSSTVQARTDSCLPGATLRKFIEHSSLLRPTSNAITFSLCPSLSDCCPQPLRRADEIHLPTSNRSRFSVQSQLKRAVRRDQDIHRSKLYRCLFSAVSRRRFFGTDLAEVGTLFSLPVVCTCVSVFPFPFHLSASAPLPVPLWSGTVSHLLRHPVSGIQ